MFRSIRSTLPLLESSPLNYSSIDLDSAMPVYTYLLLMPVLQCEETYQDTHPRRVALVPKLFIKKSVGNHFGSTHLSYENQVHLVYQAYRKT